MQSPASHRIFVEMKHVPFDSMTIVDTSEVVVLWSAGILAFNLVFRTVAPNLRMRRQSVKRCQTNQTILILNATNARTGRSGFTYYH